eukprot:2995099-Ditylum_brightwellii.AAC.1
MGLKLNGDILISEAPILQEEFVPTHEDAREDENASYAAISTRIPEPEEDIHKSILRIDEMQHNVFDEEKSKQFTRTFSDKLSSLEKELELKQKEQSLTARTSGLEDSIVLRIDKVE